MSASFSVYLYPRKNFFVLFVEYKTGLEAAQTQWREKKSLHLPETELVHPAAAAFKM